MAPDDGTTSDERLVALALQGDDGAFARLVSRHKGTVFRTASRFARNRHELDDLMQEIFIRAHEALGSFKTRAPFEHWLARIAVRKCLDLLRKRSRRAIEVRFDDNPEAKPLTIEHPPHDAAQTAMEILTPALQQLKPEELLVITLLELEELPMRTIAERTGWSIANIKVRAHRARRRLRQLLSPSPNESKS